MFENFLFRSMYRGGSLVWEKPFLEVRPLRLDIKVAKIVSVLRGHS